MPPFDESAIDPRRAAFAEILARLAEACLPGEEDLAPDERFDAFRRRLVRYFTWERSLDPEYCADETLTRVAAKIAAGQEILNFRAYAFGVARMVRLESSTRSQRESAAIEALGHSQGIPNHPRFEADADDPASDCLENCMVLLSPEQRTFILQYYGGDGAARIETRKRMAAEEGIALNALRNRALRLRDRLERCCRDCLKRRNSRGI